MSHYLDALLGKPLDFSSRASRPQFWWFQLINWIIVLGFFLLVGLILWLVSSHPTISFIGMGVIMLYMLLTFIPALSLTVRRLHDSGRSAWWLLMLAIPYIGVGAWIVLMCLPSGESNQYGRKPIS